MVTYNIQGGCTNKITEKFKSLNLNIHYIIKHPDYLIALAERYCESLIENQSLSTLRICEDSVCYIIIHKEENNP